MYDKEKSERVELVVAGLISAGEQAREHGKIGLARNMFSQAIDLANEIDDEGLVAQALGQRIICAKHRWQNEGDESFLDEMAADIRGGLGLANVPPECRAVFWLRAGDIYTAKGLYDDAEFHYAKAYDLVRSGGHEEVEYLGHLAEAMLNVGKAEEAVEMLQDALVRTSVLSDVPGWHMLIISSGLYGRLSRAAYHNWQFLLAAQSFWRGYMQARYLAKRHHMPQRLNQFHLGLRGKKV